MTKTMETTSGSLHLDVREFRQFQAFIYEVAGISLSDAKKPLVVGRLSKRLKHHGLVRFHEYFDLLQQDREERQTAIDLLTTNETYFFREPKHFDFLRDRILPGLRGKAKVRVWSGACSSGEEPYTLAMVLTEGLGHTNWEMLASDISTRVLARAQSGHYTMDDAEGIPRHLLRKYCLKGVGSQAGTFLMDPTLRSRIKFQQINLNTALPALGEFDVIFLRNVMIYFDPETKRKVMQRMLPLLKPGGHFMISHSESLNGITDGLVPVQPSIYRKPDAQA